MSKVVVNNEKSMASTGPTIPVRTTESQAAVSAVPTDKQEIANNQPAAFAQAQQLCTLYTEAIGRANPNAFNLSTDDFFAGPNGQAMPRRYARGVWELIQSELETIQDRVDGKQQATTLSMSEYQFYVERLCRFVEASTQPEWKEYVKTDAPALSAAMQALLATERAKVPRRCLKCHKHTPQAGQLWQNAWWCNSCLVDYQTCPSCKQEHSFLAQTCNQCRFKLVTIPCLVCKEYKSDGTLKGGLFICNMPTCTSK